MKITDAAVRDAKEAHQEALVRGGNPMLSALTAALPHLPLGFEAKLLSATDAAHHHREKNRKLRKRNRALLSALREVVSAKTHHDANHIANIAIAGWEDDELIHKSRSLTNVGTKPVDVAAVREAESVIERYGEEVTAAAMISVIADFLRENGKAVLLSENSFGKQILEFKLAADAIRVLSAEQKEEEPS